MQQFTVEQNQFLMELHDGVSTDNYTMETIRTEIHKHSEKPKVDGKYKLIDLHKFLNMNADGPVEKNETLGALYGIDEDNLFDIKVRDNKGRCNGSELILAHECRVDQRDPIYM